MFKKFIEGLVFGCGFAISFVAMWYIAAYLITPLFVASQVDRTASRPLSEMGNKMQPPPSRSTESHREPEVPFHDLALEEKIERSSVIALAKYEPSSDGKMKAIIKEFLKKDPDVKLYYKVGDEYPSSSYYPKERTSYGDGVVIFFTGSPATMRMSMTFSGDRIRGLGELPVELLRKKCKE